MTSLIPADGTNPWGTAFHTLWSVAHNDDGTQVTAAATRLPQNNRIWCLGDSITAGNGGHQTTPNGGHVWWGDRNWQFWAHGVSNGRLYFEDSAAVVGTTTSDMIATQVAQVVAAAPAACTVLGGTNDMLAGSNNSATADACFTNLTTIYTTLLAANILPILCTIPPHLNYGTAIPLLNMQIARYARDHGLPFVDFYSLLCSTTTVGYASGLDNSDGLHPSPSAAKLMGVYMAGILANVFPANEPFQPCTNVDTANIVSNSLLLTDTNSDGVPDNFTASGAGGTYSLATDASVLGNAFTMTRAGTNLNILLNTGSVTTGHKIYGSIAYQLAAIPAGGSITIRVMDSGFSIAHSYMASAMSQADTTWRVLQFEGTVPSGLSDARWQFLVQGASGTSLKVAQPYIVDLTAAGIT